MCLVIFLIMAGKIIFSLYYIPAIKCDFESSVKWHYSKVYKLRRKKLGILNCCLFSLLQLIFLPYPINEHIYNFLWRCCANQTSFDAKRQNTHWILISKWSSYLNWKFKKIQMYLEIKQKNPVCVWPVDSVTRGKNGSKPTQLGAKFIHEARLEQDATLNQAQMLFLVSFSRTDPWWGVSFMLYDMEYKINSRAKDILL